MLAVIKAQQLSTLEEIEELVYFLELDGSLQPRPRSLVDAANVTMNTPLKAAAMEIATKDRETPKGPRHTRRFRRNIKKANKPVGWEGRIAPNQH